MVKTSTKKVGAHYENIARDYLIDHGLCFICANYSTKCGEIDLIMQDQLCTVFIEVKYRRNAYYGHAAEMITQSKQSKLIRTAQMWLAQQRRSLHTTQFRFDVIAIENNGKKIEWIQNAITQG